MANNFNRPEKFKAIIEDMKRMGGRTYAYAVQLEDVVGPIVEQRVKAREVSRMALRKYRALHPEYREKCRVSAAKANAIRKAKRIALIVNSPTAKVVKAEEFPPRFS